MGVSVGIHSIIAEEGVGVTRILNRILVYMSDGANREGVAFSTSKKKEGSLEALVTTNGQKCFCGHMSQF